MHLLDFISFIAVSQASEIVVSRAMLMLVFEGTGAKLMDLVLMAKSTSALAISSTSLSLVTDLLLCLWVEWFRFDIINNMEQG